MKSGYSTLVVMINNGLASAGVSVSVDAPASTEGVVLTDDALWQTVLDTVHELPGSELYPFSADWDAARVHGKWFMISTIRDTRMVNLKVDPLDGIALREAYSSITPGYHMNKKHWITLVPGDDLSVDLVRELVIESYLLVVASLPKKDQPVDQQCYMSK